jgi:hypothetical protein
MIKLFVTTCAHCGARIEIQTDRKDLFVTKHKCAALAKAVAK